MIHNHILAIAAVVTFSVQLLGQFGVQINMPCQLTHIFNVTLADSPRHRLARYDETTAAAGLWAVLPGKVPEIGDTKSW